MKRVAIVTGSTSGIGRATAFALGDAGWWVLAHGRDDLGGPEVKEQLQKKAGGGFYAADLVDLDAPGAIVAAAVEEAGRVDLLVNNAGIHFLADVERTDPGDLDRLLRVNLIAPFLLAKAVIPHMRESGGGIIINVSSEAGLVGVPGQAAYNVSKGALIMLTRSLAVDHAKDGIRSITVSPGTTRTPLVEDAINSADDPVAHEKWLASSRPLNRLGTEEEIAGTIVFAASQEASFMTGSNIVIDGGYTAV